MKVTATWPVFARELADALKPWPELAKQVEGLTVVERCGCGESACQSFYTAPKPAKDYRPGHSNVLPDAPWPGYLVLDLVDGQIVYVEVLHRQPLD